MSSDELARYQKNLARAKRVEDSWRERAFLPLGVTINGVDVLQLTLRHLTLLMEFGSPFLSGIADKAEHVGQFLWIVSPEYHPTDIKKQNAFMAELVTEYPPEKFQIFYRAIYRYVWVRSLMDIPTPNGSKSRRQIGACFAAGMINRIARAYHWPMEKILDTPVAALYQLWKWIESDNAEDDKPQFNPLQDRMTQRYFDMLTEVPVAGKTNGR